MDVIYNVCCGLDVHKKKLVACLKKKGKEDVIEEFGAETKDITAQSNKKIPLKHDIIFKV